jgi:hypothetical protein
LLEKPMDLASADSPPIEGQELTTWAVLPGGTQIRLDFVAAGGRAHSLVLPVETLSGLMMTLPRMLQSALDARFTDRSLRVVQRLGAWRLEQLEGDTGLLLKLGTTDGFEVAFVLNDEHAGSLGTALLAAPDDTTPTLTGRPH